MTALIVKKLTLIFLILAASIVFPFSSSLRNEIIEIDEEVEIIEEKEEIFYLPERETEDIIMVELEKESENLEFIEEEQSEEGVASWYGPNFHGKTTASGEIYNMYEMTAAHKELDFGTVVEVTHSRNGRSVIVRINDRGPYIHGRIIDLSKAAAEEIDLKKHGLGEVEIKILETP